MTESSTTAQTPAGEGAKPVFHRSAKNYLIDRPFQLKYAGLLAGITLGLSLALGSILWSTSSKLVAQSHEAVIQGQQAVRQGQETVKHGQEVIVQSRKVSQVVAMNIAKEYRDDPELARTFAESAAQDEADLKEQQDRLERDASELKQRAAGLEHHAGEIARQQKTLFGGLVALLSLLVVGVGLAGIVFTHKIAGPIFKMKRLLRQVGEGKLVVRERLRKGDELVHFFETFEKMVDDMRARQLVEIGQVDSALVKLESELADKPDGVGLTELRRLRADMQDHLEP